MATAHRLNQHDALAEQAGFSDEQFQTLKDMLTPIRELAVAQLEILAAQKAAAPSEMQDSESSADLLPPPDFPPSPPADEPTSTPPTEPVAGAD